MSDVGGTMAGHILSTSHIGRGSLVNNYRCNETEA